MSNFKTIAKMVHRKSKVSNATDIHRWLKTAPNDHGESYVRWESLNLDCPCWYWKIIRRSTNLVGLQLY